MDLSEASVTNANLSREIVHIHSLNVGKGAIYYPAGEKG
jgi:hypothetical protein